MKNRKRWQLVAVLMVALIPGMMLSACTASEKATVPTINLGYILSDHHAPLIIAAVKGEEFHKKYGIYLQPVREKELYELYDRGAKLAQIRLIPTKQGPELQNLVAQGSVDFGISGTQAILLSVDKGVPVKLVSPLQTEGNVLVMAKGFPADSWEGFVAQVKGKAAGIRIGYPGRLTIADIIFRSGLAEEGITFTEDPRQKADVQLMDLKGHGSLASALENKIVDGFVGAQPYPAVAIEGGFGREVAKLRDLPPAGQWRGHACCSVEATERFLKEHQNLAVKLTELLILATQYVNQNQDETAAAVAYWLGLKTEVEKLALNSVGFTTDPTPAWLASVATFLEVMAKEGQVQGQLLGKSREELASSLYAFDIYRKAIAELKERKLIQD